MKIRSFNFIVSLATVGVLLGSTGIQASHRNHSSSCEPHAGKYCFSGSIVEQKKDKVTYDLHAIFGSLNTIFAVEGTTDNPNPLTNAQLAATIDSETAKMNANIEQYLQVLRSLGVRSAKRQAIDTANMAWIDAGLAYALSVNLGNTGDEGETQEVQDALAVAFNSAGTVWGTLLADEANDSKILKDVETVTYNMINLVQTFRGVLVGGVFVDADPADPASEAEAATAINTANHALAKKIGALLVYGINHEKCGK